jgi:hypothetical protein
MKLNKIRDLDISKEKYEWVNDVKIKVDYKKWVEFIDNNQDYFIWYENTKDGIHRKNNLDKIPENYRDGFILKLNKLNAFSNYNEKEKYYENRVRYHRDFGIIMIDFESKPRKKDLEICIKMAEHLEAYLLIDGKKIITRKDLENEEIT